MVANGDGELGSRGMCEAVYTERAGGGQRWRKTGSQALNSGGAGGGGGGWEGKWVGLLRGGRKGPGVSGGQGLWHGEKGERGQATALVASLIPI